MLFHPSVVCDASIEARQALTTFSSSTVISAR
jgi:hypothetical protein